MDISIDSYICNISNVKLIHGCISTALTSISQSTIPQEWLLTPMFLKATNMIGGGVWECVHSILQFFSPLIRLIGSLFYLRMTWLWRIIGVVFKWSRRMRYAVLKNRMGEMIFLLASY